MNAQCAVQQAFSFRHDKEVVTDFDGGRITSDAGLVALREFDHQIGFTEQIVACLHDDRNPLRVIHTLMVLVIQRLYALVAGYEDQNDATLLRHDGLFQLITGKAHLGDALASQPTLCRFENSVSARENGALNPKLCVYLCSMKVLRALASYLSASTHR